MFVHMLYELYTVSLLRLTHPSYTHEAIIKSGWEKLLLITVF